MFAHVVARDKKLDQHPLPRKTHRDRPSYGRDWKQSANNKTTSKSGMKISIHTTITNPKTWGYPYLEALRSFCDVADEVIVIDGGSKDGSIEVINSIFKEKIKIITVPWPWEYGQEEFPKHLNAGLEACTGDWAIKTDIDYVFHEKDITDLKVRLKYMHEQTNWLAATYEKVHVINKNRAFRKARLPFIIHKSMAGDGIKYGIQKGVDLDDWSFPVMPLKGETYKGVPIGKPLFKGMVNNTGIDVWNYDYFFRTETETKILFARNARAFRRSVNSAWGKDDEDAWNTFVAMTKGRLQRQFIPLEIESHPKYVQDRIRNMTEDQFGFNNWNIKP